MTLSSRGNMIEVSCSSMTTVSCASMMADDQSALEQPRIALVLNKELNKELNKVKKEIGT